MTYLDRAIKDGYAIITGPENKQMFFADRLSRNGQMPKRSLRKSCWENR